MGPHPESVLSAYVDDALDAVERAQVAAHLAACDLCASRARELSATVRLLRALPDPRPSRSLVPRFARTPAWCAPARLLSGIASGAFALLFLAAALGAVGASGGSTTAVAPAAAPNEFAPGLGAGPAATGSQRTDVAKGGGQASSAPPSGLQDAATAASQSAPGRPATAASASPAASPRDQGQPSPSSVALPAARAPTTPEPAPRSPSPLLWLVLAVVSGGGAALLHVRMRAR